MTHIRGACLHFRRARVGHVFGAAVCKLQVRKCYIESLLSVPKDIRKVRSTVASLLRICLPEAGCLIDIWKSFIVHHTNITNCLTSLIPRPCSAFHHFRTNSNGKLDGAWERGYCLTAFWSWLHTQSSSSMSQLSLLVITPTVDHTIF